MPCNIIDTQCLWQQKRYCCELVTLTPRSLAQTFNTLPMFLLELLFCCFSSILFHIPNQRIGTVFKALLIGAYPVSTDFFSKGTLTHQLVQQFYTHEYSSHENTPQDTDESSEYKKKSIEFWNVWCLESVEDYETQTSHCRQEAGCVSFPIYCPFISQTKKAVGLLPRLTSHKAST